MADSRFIWPTRLTPAMADATEAALGRDLEIAHRLAASLARRLRLVEQRLRLLPHSDGGYLHYATLYDDAKYIRDNLAGWNADLDDLLATGLHIEEEELPVAPAKHLGQRCPTCGEYLTWEFCIDCDGIGLLGTTFPREGGPCPYCQEEGGIWVCWPCEEASIDEVHYYQRGPIAVTPREQATDKTKRQPRQRRQLL